MSATTPDTEVPLLKAIAGAYGVSSASVGDTEVPILKQIAEQLGITVANVGDTEVPILKQIALHYGILTPNLGDSEVPLLKQIVLSQPGTTITTPILGDTEIPLLVQWLQFASGSVIPTAEFFWRADQNVTGNPVTAWASGSNILSATGAARPSVGTAFVPHVSILFNGSSNYLAQSPNPVMSSSGSVAIVFKTGTFLGINATCLIATHTDVGPDFIELAIGSDGSIFLFHNVSPYTTSLYSTAAGVISENTEYQIFLSFDGSSYFLSLNGVQQVFTLIAGSPIPLGHGWFGDTAAPDTLYVGAQYSTPIEPMIGSIGVVWMWSTVLTSTERSLVYAYLDTNWIQDIIPPLADWIATAGVTSSTIGQPVSSWLSGSYNLAQATALNKPTHVAQFTTGHGVDFDGSDDYLSVANPFSTTVGSIAIVFQPQLISAKQVMVAVTNTGVNNSWFEIGITAEGRIYIERNKTGTVSRMVGSSILTANTNYVLIIAYDGSSSYYVTLNGVEENPLVVETTGVFEYAWFGSISGGDTFSAGGALPLGTVTRPFNGVIGVIRVWNYDITH